MRSTVFSFWWAHCAALFLLAGYAIEANAAVGTLADSNGQVVAWGFNTDGQMTVPSGKFTAVAAGSRFSLGILSDGTLAGWGRNNVGQITVPSGTFTAVAAGFDQSVATRSDGTLAGWGFSQVGLTFIPGGAFTNVAAGDEFNLAIYSGGALAGWGDNDFGQTTVPSGTFTAVAAGGNHSLGIRSDGMLAGWGLDFWGQATVPNGTFTAVAAGLTHSLGIRSDGTLAGWGDNSFGQITVPSGTFTAVAARSNHSLGIRSDGTLVGWGFNADGQTDVPSGTFTAVAAGDFHGLALRARTNYDGDLRIFGTGMTATLNRSIEVANDVTIESPVNYYNDPTVEIGGKLIFAPGAAYPFSSSQGTFVTHGLQLNTNVFLADNSIANGGPITGTGNLLLYNNVHLDVVPAPINVYSGSITLRAGSVLAMHGPGVQSAMAGVEINPGGELRMADGQRLVAHYLTNQGTMELLGGSAAGCEIESPNFLNNFGLITGRNVVLRNINPLGGLYNFGTMALTGGTNDMFGVFDNRSNFVVSGGATATFHNVVYNHTPSVAVGITISGNSDATFLQYVENGANSQFRVSAGSSATFFGPFSGSGISGPGSVFFEAGLSPGASPAAASFGGDVTLGPSSALVIELGGTSPGTKYDQLHVSDNLLLGGTLNVSLINAGEGLFAPQAGDSFDILDWGSRSGTFATLLLPALSGSLTWDTTNLYTTGVLAVVAPGLGGDYNNNGVVDGTDYILWRKGGPLANEVDTPGTVNGGDYTAWRARFGQPAGSGAALPSAQPLSAAVPEPRTVWLVACAVPLLIWRRHRGIAPERSRYIAMLGLTLGGQFDR